MLEPSHLVVFSSFFTLANTAILAYQEYKAAQKYLLPRSIRIKLIQHITNGKDISDFASHYNIDIKVMNSDVNLLLKRLEVRLGDLKPKI